MPANTTGFVYEWKPFGTVSKLDNKECQPLHISFVVPCVLLIVVDKENYELLGEFYDSIPYFLFKEAQISKKKTLMQRLQTAKS
jgi:hypothetical protein